MTSSQLKAKWWNNVICKSSLATAVFNTQSTQFGKI